VPIKLRQDEQKFIHEKVVDIFKEDCRSVAAYAKDIVEEYENP
jgi:hypothetical protein